MGLGGPAGGRQRGGGEAVRDFKASAPATAENPTGGGGWPAGSNVGGGN